MAYTTIDDPRKHHKSVAFTGDGSNARAITIGFEPDFTWMRQRTDASGGYLVNSISGNNAALQTTNTNSEGTFANMTFTSTGITVTGNENLNNENAHDYVCWNWKGSDASTAANSNGSLSSTVSANTTAGFSVVNYQGNQTAGATVGHGLSSAPELLIIKNRDADGYGWLVGHSSGSSAFEKNLVLNTTAALSDETEIFNDTAPSSTVFTLGSDTFGNKNGDDLICYAFHSVKGYSQIGSFEGNANANGNYVYTGFKPAFLLFKNADDTRQWGIVDNARSPTNKTLATLEPSVANAENTSDNFDFFANGFRAASTDPGSNGNNNTIVYMAIAENPFVSSKGIPTTAR